MLLQVAPPIFHLLLLFLIYILRQLPKTGKVCLEYPTHIRSSPGFEQPISGKLTLTDTQAPRNII